MSDTPDEWFPPCSSLVDSLHSIANKLPHVDKMRVRDAAESVQRLELEIADLRRQLEEAREDSEGLGA
jgi:predicted phage tail protein